MIQVIVYLWQYVDSTGAPWIGGLYRENSSGQVALLQNSVMTGTNDVYINGNNQFADLNVRNLYANSNIIVNSSNGATGVYS